MVTDTSVATCAGHQLSGEWSFGKQRTVNPPIAPARYNFLYPSSRPALRAAACGGRPRPRSRWCVALARHEPAPRTAATPSSPGTSPPRAAISTRVGSGTEDSWASPRGWVAGGIDHGRGSSSGLGAMLSGQRLLGRCATAAKTLRTPDRSSPPGQVADDRVGLLGQVLQ